MPLTEEEIASILSQEIDYVAECRICNKETVITMTSKQYFGYIDKNRPIIQEIFPELTPDIRELLVSGTCGICWEDMFNDLDR